MALIRITDDVYYIADRLKEIDKNYFIVFNTVQKRFEIHNSSQPISSFCLIVPKNKLDASLIEWVKKTRIENQRKFLEEMEKENEKLTREKANNIIDESAEKLEEIGRQFRGRN